MKAPRFPPKPCGYCGKEFRPFQTTSRWCSRACSMAICRNRALSYYYRNRATQAEPFDEAEPDDPPTLACERCVNWAPMPGSDLGGMCRAEKFRSCRPWTTAAHLEDRRTA